MAPEATTPDVIEHEKMVRRLSGLPNYPRENSVVQRLDDGASVHSLSQVKRKNENHLFGRLLRFFAIGSSTKGSAPTVQIVKQEKNTAGP